MSRARAAARATSLTRSVALAVRASLRSLVARSAAAGAVPVAALGPACSGVAGGLSPGLPGAACCGPGWARSTAPSDAFALSGDAAEVDRLAPSDEQPTARHPASVSTPSMRKPLCMRFPFVDGCDARRTEGALSAVAPQTSRVGQASRLALGRRLDQVLERLQVGQRFAAGDPPLPLPPDRLGESEFQQRVEVAVGGLQHLPEHPVQLVLG